MYKDGESFMIDTFPYKQNPHLMPALVLRHHAEYAAKLFNISGIDNAISYLLAPLEQYYGITRASFFWYDRILQVGIATHDVPSDTYAKDKTIFHFKGPVDSPNIREGIGELAPVIVNNLNLHTGDFNKTEWKDFLRHRSFARLALLEKENFIYYALFHGDEENIFSTAVILQLQELLQPLILSLLESKTIDLLTYQRWNSTQQDPSDILIQASAGLTDIIFRTNRVATTDLAVLIQGETGCGKGLFTDFIHKYSKRSEGPFIKINCGALPESLADSLFFGNEKGAFTGAISRVAGYFEQANRGTLFLDEVGELSLGLQVKLLRVLDRKIIRRLSGETDIPVDFRLIAATNRDLKKMVQEGTFRQDLWYRLAQYPILIPPLREHKEDIIPLAYYFIEQHKELIPVSQIAIISNSEGSRLTQYYWPGNIRELEFSVCRAMLESSGTGKRLFLHFQLEEQETVPTISPKEEDTKIPIKSSHQLPTEDLFQNLPSLSDLSDIYIQYVMEKFKNNIEKAAQILGIHPQTLYRKWRGVRKK